MPRPCDPCCTDPCLIFEADLEIADTSSLGSDYDEVAGDWYVEDELLKTAGNNAILKLTTPHPDSRASGIVYVRIESDTAGDVARVMLNYSDSTHYSEARFKCGERGSVELWSVAGSTLTYHGEHPINWPAGTVRQFAVYYDAATTTFAVAGGGLFLRAELNRPSDDSGFYAAVGTYGTTAGVVSFSRLRFSKYYHATDAPHCQRVDKRCNMLSDPFYGPASGTPYGISHSGATLNGDGTVSVANGGGLASLSCNGDSQATLLSAEFLAAEGDVISVNLGFGLEWTSGGGLSVNGSYYRASVRIGDLRDTEEGTTGSIELYSVADGGGTTLLNQCPFPPRCYIPGGTWITLSAALADNRMVVSVAAGENPEVSGSGCCASAGNLTINTGGAFSAGVSVSAVGGPVKFSYLAVSKGHHGTYSPGCGSGGKCLQSNTCGDCWADRTVPKTIEVDFGSLQLAPWPATRDPEPDGPYVYQCPDFEAGSGPIVGGIVGAANECARIAPGKFVLGPVYMENQIPDGGWWSCDDNCKDQMGCSRGFLIGSDFWTCKNDAYAVPILFCAYGVGTTSVVCRYVACWLVYSNVVFGVGGTTRRYHLVTVTIAGGCSGASTAEGCNFPVSYGNDWIPVARYSAECNGYETEPGEAVTLSLEVPPGTVYPDDLVPGSLLPCQTMSLPETITIRGLSDSLPTCRSTTTTTTTTADPCGDHPECVAECSPSLMTPCSPVDSCHMVCVSYLGGPLMWQWDNSGFGQCDSGCVCVSDNAVDHNGDPFDHWVWYGMPCSEADEGLAETLSATCYDGSEGEMSMVDACPPGCDCLDDDTSAVLDDGLPCSGADLGYVGLIYGHCGGPLV